MKEHLTIKSVCFGFSEDLVSNNKTFKNLREADLHLIGRNSQAERENLMGYWKTDFTITFSNDETYKGRYDIGADYPTLSDHVVSYLKQVTDRSVCPRYPYRNTEEAQGVINIILSEAT